MAAHDCKHEGDIAVLVSESRATRLDVADIKKVLVTGNGVPPMTVRMAKIEQVAAILIWVSTIVSGSVLGLIIAAVWRAVTKG